MKKFKLIKKYPNCPNLGTIIDETGFDGNMTSWCNPKDHLEFWEEIVEKDYEILSFKKFDNIKIVTKSVNDQIWLNPNPEPDDLTWLIENNYNIHSVRRLSDGEVFTINDKIKTFDCGYKPISSIRIEDNICRIGVREHGLRPLKNCEKQKQPLFTTKDCVDIYVGMSSYCVHKNTWTLGSLIQHNNKDYKYFEPSAANWWFSTKEKAEEYILENKPCLSLRDVRNCKTTYANTTDLIINARNLVKSKL